MIIGAYVFLVIASYLLGSIPTGYLAGRAKGVDVRKVGSGNIGATNAFRVLGKKAGIIVLLVDALKGFAAARWIPWLTLKWFPMAAGQWENFFLVAGVAAILGHNFTCWLKFKGGKGVATSAGVVLAWAPWAGLIAVAVWIIVAATTKFVSLASIMAAIILPIAAWFFHGSLKMVAVMAFMSAMVIYKHRPNIQRLLRGTENRIGGPKPPKPLEP